ncbi:homoserine dehydrogenase [Dongia mobilis]|uniref:Homoserine dehydrogenase n=1 Tax=Dongia mobilis TaxID=578943 RepID=A0A4R6WPZ1_9PROT|nr:homoserine dehydrogenase [Dongia mobilis]TDQ83175.1 homoserine dehydrogenase [Dongia mobilis]
MAADRKSAPLRIGLAGIGTVGAGVIEVLRENADIISKHCPRPILVTAVSARDRGRDRGIDLSGIAWVDDAAALAARDDVDVVVEVIGGSEGKAKEVVEKAIAAGKHVVTANKALLAHHGTALALAAEEAEVALAYEAAVAGGIPVIKAMREGLAANRITRVYGILNGTCNYILTQMRETGREFADVLEEAQKLGYAEADPSFDVDGIDAAHKLSILTSVAFGCAVDFAGVRISGIRNVSAMDIAYAEELGFRIKLLGLARQTPGGIEQRVHACMVPAASTIAKVDGVYNAVVTSGNFVGENIAIGRGAGRGPTASAVVADLMDIARDRILPAFSAPAATLARAVQAPVGQRVGSYYLRLMVVDKPGVIAEIAGVMRDENVSLESMIQRGRSPDEPVPLVFTTHETTEAAIARVAARLDEIKSVLEPAHLLPIETLE